MEQLYYAIVILCEFYHQNSKEIAQKAMKKIRHSTIKLIT